MKVDFRIGKMHKVMMDLVWCVKVPHNFSNYFTIILNTQRTLPKQNSLRTKT